MSEETNTIPTGERPDMQLTPDEATKPMTLRLRNGATPLRQVAGRDLPDGGAGQFEVDAEFGRAIIRAWPEFYAEVLPIADIPKLKT